MRKKMVISLLVAAACIFISNGAFAAWTQAKGHSYNQLTLSYYETKQKTSTIQRDSNKQVTSLNSGIHRIDSAKFVSTKVSYYGEYGITNQLTAIASGGWDWVRSNDNLKYAGESGPSGIGDIILGLRQKISDNIGGGALMSVQVDVKVPEAYDYKSPTTYQSLGEGQYDTSVNLLIGKGFAKGYAVLSTGYKYRFENDQLGAATFKPSDQFLFSINGGYAATPKLSVRCNLNYNQAIGNAKVSQEMEQLFIPYGNKDKYDDVLVIKDSLNLEQNNLSAGLALAYSITSKIQTVASYSTDLVGIGDLRTRDGALGKTFSMTLVYMH
ncbi:MAG TPA: hypothetical protein ENG83_06465 [Nitrospirae bacterium]|nr:hypothetical protein BMS3Abin06_01089 [bacterium BMS3Abin06]HDH11824.1 hypothetical protein [Nitrospirota bacterium]HDZ02834.1 hypothetical protein [Nitrospirota bacterium]